MVPNGLPNEGDDGVAELNSVFRAFFVVFFALAEPEVFDADPFGSFLTAVFLAAPDFAAVFLAGALRAVFLAGALRAVFLAGALRAVFLAGALRAVFLAGALRAVFLVVLFTDDFLAAFLVGRLVDVRVVFVTCLADLAVFLVAFFTLRAPVFAAFFTAFAALRTVFLAPELVPVVREELFFTTRFVDFFAVDFLAGDSFVCVFFATFLVPTGRFVDFVVTLFLAGAIKTSCTNGIMGLTISVFSNAADCQEITKYNLYSVSFICADSVVLVN